MIYKHYLDNITIKYYTGNLTNCWPEWGFDNITPPYNKLYYITEGQCQIELNGARFTANPGQVFLLPRGSTQSYRLTMPENRLVKYWVHFSATCNDMDLFELISVPPFITIGYDPKMIGLFQNIIDLEKRNDLTSLLEQKAAILKLIVYYIEKTNSSISYENYDERVTWLMEYIANNLASEITVGALAEMLHLHPNYFIRFFKTQTGQAPMNFIAEQRINKARELLRTSDFPVGEIAAMVGIDDYSYFSRQFKKATSLSPSEYRNMMQSADVRMYGPHSVVGNNLPLPRNKPVQNKD